MSISEAIAETLENINIVIGERIENATELGRSIPKAKGKLAFA